MQQGGGAPLFFSIFGFSALLHSAMLKNCCSPNKIAIMWWVVVWDVWFCAVFQILWFLNTLLIKNRKLGKRAESSPEHRWFTATDPPTDHPQTTHRPPTNHPQTTTTTTIIIIIIIIITA